jgi:hypothetical protein
MDPNSRGPLVTDSALNPYAAPTSSVAPAAETEISPISARAPQVAGVIMLATVPAALISAGTHPGATYLAILFDVLIGVSLVRGNLKYRSWAVFRCVLGLLLYGGPAAAKGEVGEAVGIAAFSGSLLLLLVGTPGKVRTIFGAVGAGLLTALAYVGLLAGGG